jgi:hypothetical protein
LSTSAVAAKFSVRAAFHRLFLGAGGAAVRPSSGQECLG